jgi:hypothetical protein
MAAELGQTLDPRELIPGSPDAIAQDLRALVGTLQRVAQVGGDLGSVGVVEWTGAAASAFTSAFGQEPPKWMQAVQDLGTGGQVLADFGDTLTWAQGQAQQAIEMYTQGMAASRAAAAQALTTAQQGIVGPMTDPAVDMLHNAQTVLNNARERLAAAGGSIAQMFGMQPDGEGKYTQAIGQERGFGLENQNRQGWQQSRAGRGYQREFGSQQQGQLGDMLGGLISGTLKQLGIDIPEGEWNAKAEAKVWGGETSGEFDSGFFSGKGSLSADAVGAGAEAHAKWGPDGITAGASAEAYLFKAAAEGELGFGDHASVNGKGEVFLGAKAEAESNIGWSGVDVGAEAFAGVRAEADVGAEVAGIGAGVHGEAWAGAGAQASAQFGMGDDGKFHVGGSVGLGLGVGAKLGADVSVGPRAVGDTVADGGGGIGDGISRAADTGDQGHSNAAGAAPGFLGV